MPTLFLCGDVMTGRGIDQVLPHPVDPRLFEGYVHDAQEYVALAERANGRIARGAAFDSVWGDALAEIEGREPAARIVNLETAITADGRPWPGKGIHYRMHPANVPCLAAARIDCCSLANNHALDWGREGLAHTLAALRDARIGAAGAGADVSAADAPAIVEQHAGRVLVLARATETSGVPREWEATAARPGVALLRRLDAAAVERIAHAVWRLRKPGDIVVFSIHWGGNWGHAITGEDREFAHALVDRAGVDVVHGHSSHHPRAIEVHRERPIFYGCGDLVNDYEGIGGYEAFRPDLSWLYFPRLAADGHLEALELVGMRMRRFRLERASAADTTWLANSLRSASKAFDVSVVPERGGTVAVRWNPS